VIERRRCPGTEALMAGVALPRGCNVRSRLHLSVLCQIAAAVTVRTLSVKPGVVHRRRRKCDGILVTGITRTAGGDVCRGLGQGLGERIRTIVAGRTLP
jgi:hypothetical protein